MITISSARLNRLRGTTRGRRASVGAASGWWLAARPENIAFTTLGQEITGPARIGLELAPEPRDLGVDRAIRAADAAALAELLAADREPRLLGQDLQQRQLGVGQMDALLAAPQLLAGAIERERAEAQRLVAAARRGATRRRIVAIRSSSSRGSNGLTR